MSRYQVPEVLQHVRRVRAESASQTEILAKLSPSRLYAMCENEVDGGEGVVRALYNHVFIEAGFVAWKPEPNFEPYNVCPVCGYVFEGG